LPPENNLAAFFYQERLRRVIQNTPASAGRTNAVDPQMGFAAVGVSVGGK